MQRILIAVIVITVGAGTYLYYNSSQNKAKQTEEYSKNVQNLTLAKPSEEVVLKNGDTYNLTAGIVKKNLNGKEVKMLAYNGSIPGPLIKVPQNAKITMNFKNDTDVDSTIHSHGVRVENKFDGVPDITQKPVKPGETFTYKLIFPDAGIFWYHPHVREDYAQELGLYGNFLVVPSEKHYWAEVDREEALFLDDILMQNGKIATFSKSMADHTLMGRFGNVMLVNGEDNYKLNIKQGERVRFYITNAANTRVFNFSIPNTRMKLVGADNGKYEREEWVEEVLIGPSERTVVEIWFDNFGNYQIVNKTPQKIYTLGEIVAEEQPVTVSYLLVPRENQDFISSLTGIRSLFTKTADKTLNLTLDMMGGMMGNQEGGHMMPDGSMMGGNMMMGNSQEKIDPDSIGIEWEDDMAMMNAMSTNKTLKWKLVDDDTKQENMDINWQFRKTDKIKLKLINDPKAQHPMQHPIHIHGQRFLVVSTNDVPNQNLVWKDTALIQTGDTVELLVQMDNPGTWVIHCHIPEHMEAGMMSKFKVI